MSSIFQITEHEMTVCSPQWADLLAKPMMEVKELYASVTSVNESQNDPIGNISGNDRLSEAIQQAVGDSLNELPLQNEWSIDDVTDTA